jgi:hypothetical protein
MEAVMQQRNPRRRPCDASDLAGGGPTPAIRDGVVHHAGRTLPVTTDDLAASVWFAYWDRPVALDHGPFPGSTVWLYSQSADVLVWETEVADAIAVPFETVGAFTDHVEARFGEELWIDGPTLAPGFGVAWTARAVRRLDRRVPDGGSPLRQWAVPRHLDPDEARRWGFADTSGRGR